MARAEDLALDNLAALKEAPTPTELLVVGCGPRAVFLPPALRASLKSAGLSLEVVDTGSACRTYNVLLAEGRRVAAALIPVQLRWGRATPVARLLVFGPRPLAGS